MIPRGADPIFFSLLRSGMYGEPLPYDELPDSIDWKSVTALAHRHAVLGIIIESVPLLPGRLRPQGQLAAKMNKFALGLIQANLILDQTAGRLVSFFREHGIEGVLLKGQGVARYYKVPQMRQSGDIDFYVGKTLYKEALDLCKVHLVKDKDTCKETSQHFSFHMDGVLIELHRLAARISSPFRNKRFQRWAVDQLEHSPDRRMLSIGNADIILPSLDFDVIYVFYHAWWHFITGGIGLRQLCDWAMILHSCGNEIDTVHLKKNIELFGLEKGWKLFASIAVNYLGVPEDKMPLYDPVYSDGSAMVLKDIIEGGNFGHYSKGTTVYPVNGYDFRYGMHLVRVIARNFITFFPIIPFEAACICVCRLSEGARAGIRRSLQKLRH